MEGLVNVIVGALSGINKDIIIFIISLLPILELRGGLIAASLLNVNIYKALLICFIGNLLPIPFVLILLNKIFDILRKWKVTKKLVDFLEKKLLSKRSQLDKYGYYGLLLFVGIPLPGTGAWTGSGLAVLLGLDKKKSFIFIVLGILLAELIMGIFSYGILGNLVH
jgi:uncharacterized membrane protein